MGGEVRSPGGGGGGGQGGAGQGRVVSAGQPTAREQVAREQREGGRPPPASLDCQPGLKHLQLLLSAADRLPRSGL